MTSFSPETTKFFEDAASAAQQRSAIAYEAWWLSLETPDHSWGSRKWFYDEYINEARMARRALSMLVGDGRLF